MAEDTLNISDAGAQALGVQLAQAFNPRAVEPGIPAPRPPDETWNLSGGTAWVYRVPGKATLTQPVIIADGFSGGASTLDEWASMWAGSEIADTHPWGTQLHEHGRDVIILGYKSRNAPILDNARVATECIRKAGNDRAGDAPLVVGGLSMGGLVTRYALAQMEMQRMDHQVGTYFSYDSPHRGAWIPLSLQVFAHRLAELGEQFAKPELKAMSALMNSGAARELLWRHTHTHRNLDSTFEPDQKRTDFVAALQAVGDYPMRPRKLGVANGRGDGQGLDEVEPGEKNLVWPLNATLYAQAAGTDKTVATLSGLINPVKTSAILALDGAPGGTLNSFGIAEHALNEQGFNATVAFPDVCFVPVASAVDLADPSDPFAPVDNMNPDASGLDDFKVASQNEGHTLITKELCDWLTERF
jgi:hypothetical protein